MPSARIGRGPFAPPISMTPPAPSATPAASEFARRLAEDAINAPAGELAAAISESRRQPAATRLLLVPVNTRTWSAHIPTDAPPVVKSLLARLKSA